MSRFDDIPCTAIVTCAAMAGGFLSALTTHSSWWTILILTNAMGVVGYLCGVRALREYNLPSSASWADFKIRYMQAQTDGTALRLKAAKDSWRTAFLKVSLLTITFVAIGCAILVWR